MTVDTLLQDGQCVDLGEGATLEVRHTPGLSAEAHSARVRPRLRLAAAARVPIVIRTMQGHMNTRTARLG